MGLGRVFNEANPLLLEGLKMTVGVTALSLLLALVLGLISCFFTISKKAPLRWISRIYVGLIRGTPMLVQVFYIFFALPQLLQFMGYNVRFTPFIAGLITLTLNAGAYMSEIFRGAINAVSTGQMEAARSLGLAHGQAMKRVILPQALRICLPSLVNQFIITLKDSTLISVIGFADIMYQAKIYQGRTMLSFATYTWVGIYFLVIILILTYIAKVVERKVQI
ncbi:MAG TPA: amino acid ABC transporter permease [Bacillota bacterium]|nr:amino acid ABC transporter permease [Bacillota bacterium]